MRSTFRVQNIDQTMSIFLNKKADQHISSAFLITNAIHKLELHFAKMQIFNTQLQSSRTNASSFLGLHL